MHDWPRNPTFRRDLLWIALIGLLVQGFWALRMTHPSYFDAYDYTSNARRLAEGHGFTQETIWLYLDEPQGMPHPSFTYWMPLPALVGAIGYVLTGTFRGAQIPFWLMAGLLPWLGYVIGWRLTGQRRQAWVAALFTASGGFYAADWGQPTTSVLFAWTGGGCLLALAMAEERARGGLWLLAGLAAGLGHLTRPDGLLLLLAGGWVWVLGLRNGNSWGWRRQGRHVLLFLLGYLLTMGAWFWRTYELTGGLISTVGMKTAFMTTYDDLFSYGRSFTFRSYLAWGWANILTSKVEALFHAVRVYVGATGLMVLGPFTAWGWWRCGRNPETARFLRPLTWYAFGLFTSMTFVFTLPGPHGSLLHSSTALWPWSMALAVAGIDLAVEWIARRRPAMRVEHVKWVAAILFTVVVFDVGFVASRGQPLRDDEAALFREIAAAIPHDAIVMVGSPPNFHYQTGLRAIVVPNEAPDVLLTVARRYGANYLVLDKDRPKPLADLLEGKVRLDQIHELRRFGDSTVLYEIRR
jgi:hypothetical protein